MRRCGVCVSVWAWRCVRLCVYTIYVCIEGFRCVRFLCSVHIRLVHGARTKRKCAFARFNPFVILFIYYFATCIMELSVYLFRLAFCVPFSPFHSTNIDISVWWSIYLQRNGEIMFAFYFPSSSETFMGTNKWIRVVIHIYSIKSSSWTTTCWLCSPSCSKCWQQQQLRHSYADRAYIYILHAWIVGLCGRVSNVACTLHRW